MIEEKSLHWKGKDELDKLVSIITDSYNVIYPTCPNPPDFYLLKLENRLSSQVKVKKWEGEIKVKFYPRKSYEGKLDYRGTIIVENENGQKSYDIKLKASGIQSSRKWLEELLNIIYTCGIKYKNINMPEIATMPRVEINDVKSFKCYIHRSNEYIEDKKAWGDAIIDPFKTIIEWGKGNSKGKVTLENTMVWIGNSDEKDPLKTNKEISVDLKGTNVDMKVNFKDNFLEEHYSSLCKYLLYSELQDTNDIFERRLQINGKPVNYVNYLDKIISNYIGKINIQKIQSNTVKALSPEKNDTKLDEKCKLGYNGSIPYSYNEETDETKYCKNDNAIISKLSLVRNAGFVKSYKKLMPFMEDLEDISDKLKIENGKQRERPQNTDHIK